MTKRLISIIQLLIILPLVPLIQGCPSCNSDFIVDVIDIHWQVTDRDFSLDTPLDRNTIRLNAGLVLNQSLVHTPIVNPFISNAYAASCRDSFFPNTSIASIRLFQEGVDITENFVVDTHESILYMEIDTFLESERDDISIVHTVVPNQTNLTWIIETALRDDQMFLDTLNFRLR